MSFRIAINGLGRIGRSVLRAYYENHRNQGLELVALNEIADLNTLAHLTRYDSTHGRFPGKVEVDRQFLRVDGHSIPVSQIEELQNLPWSAHQVDLVMECTGAFTARADAQIHLDRGAKRVLFSQPAEKDVDATIVYGVNHDSLQNSDTIISNASCTTNCIVPVIDALHKRVGIESGLITTIHSLMNDQPVIDAYHHTNLRLTRSASQSIIPVETGLAIGIERILPHLEGCFEAQALRVPTVNVSAIDLTIQVKEKVTVESINSLIKEAADDYLPNVLSYTDEPLASCDFNHDQRSSIVDLGQTRVSGQSLVKVLVWFDNEWAYANRMMDVAKLIAKLS